MISCPNGLSRSCSVHTLITHGDDRARATWPRSDQSPSLPCCFALLGASACRVHDVDEPVDLGVDVVGVWLPERDGAHGQRRPDEHRDRKKRLMR